MTEEELKEYKIRIEQSFDFLKEKYSVWNEKYIKGYNKSIGLSYFETFLFTELSEMKVQIDGISKCINFILDEMGALGNNQKALKKKPKPQEENEDDHN